MGVRWALQEVGQAYDIRLLSFKVIKEPGHLVLHPFGQIPTYEEGELALFESGAIILHVAERYAGLLPIDANARARAIAWIFAALNTVEPPIIDRSIATLFEREKPWYGERLPILEDRIRTRLDGLSRRLATAEWLDDRFSVGDLMMVTVLRRLHGSGLLEETPNLSDYVARGEARPAYKRAFEEQLAIFNRPQPSILPSDDAAPKRALDYVNGQGIRSSRTLGRHGRVQRSIDSVLGQRWHAFGGSARIGWRLVALRLRSGLGIRPVAQSRKHRKAAVTNVSRR